MQGRRLSSEQVERIKRLLNDTDLTIPEISVRMQCARSCIVTINHKFQIRHYGGRRSNWERSWPSHGAYCPTVGLQPACRSRNDPDQSAETVSKITGNFS